MSDPVVSSPVPLVVSAPVPLQDQLPPGTRLGQVLAITSGKGGVGKTFFSANLACALAQRGMKVLVVDADFGLANLDVVLNLAPKVTMHDVFAGKATIDQAIQAAPGGFWALLAGSGLAEYARLTTTMRDEFSRMLALLRQRYDVILLDTGAGISEVVLFAISQAQEVLVVATPEPTSLTDAYATIKVLYTQQGRRQIRLVVNQSTRLGDGRAITTQLQQVLDRFVSKSKDNALRLLHLGDIPQDSSVRQAVMRRQLMLQTMPASQASLALMQIAGKVQDTLLPPSNRS
jgi:flagellar biosynthesis protein FlhG